MIDFDILNECGTTNERLRQFLTAKLPGREALERMTDDERKALDADIAMREKFEDMVEGWLSEHIEGSLKNHHLYAAVDMAWDSAPINKMILPLMMYAQGRIDIGRAKTALAALPESDREQYVRKNDSGDVVGIDLPKFTEMNINLVRSVITRRVAAQDSKYANLWPYWFYESRSTTQLGKLRADLMSQRMDIMADQYDHRHFVTQVIRDMFLYPDGGIAFPRASWEREVQWEREIADAENSAGYVTESDGSRTIRKRARVVKEGISWVNPHPSRVFYDNAYALSSLNSDSGCEYAGFWDVCRYGDIAANPMYFNRDAVNWTSDAASWFSNYRLYFDQYYGKQIKAPSVVDQDPGFANDRKNAVGVYSANEKDCGTFFSHVWMKIKPQEWGIGSYPFPMWVHLKVAGFRTAVFADIMPSSPAAVFQHNCHDSRLKNVSVAHELMQFQDILTNLYSQLLETIKADLFSVAVLNTDIFPDTPEGKKLLTEFRNIMTGKNWYASMQVLETSFEKLSQVIGKEIGADMVFKVIRATPNTAITAIFEAITRVIAMSERLMVMSAHEQGQAAPHEISATESNQIAGSTDTIYSFIGNAADEGRAAMKRIMSESLLTCGSDTMHLPVVNRYPKAMLEKAGWRVVDEDEGQEVPFVTVMGSRRNLIHDYIFTSRDGGERASNSQAATVLVQMLQAIGSLAPELQRAILGSMGKEKLFEVLNTIFRKADAGVDMKLELQPGDDNTLLVDENQQVMGLIQRLAEALKQNTMDIQNFKAEAAKMLSGKPAEPPPEISYKDAPPSVRRQMERQAGFTPAGPNETALEVKARA